MREECVLVFYLTQDGLYIAEDRYHSGHRARASLPLRAPVRRAFDLDARRLILAHNHPSGSHEPSTSDIAATRRFRSVVEALEIHLDDHCIVSRGKVVSMRERGMI